MHPINRYSSLKMKSAGRVPSPAPTLSGEELAGQQRGFGIPENKLNAKIKKNASTAHLCHQLFEHRSAHVGF